MVILVSSVDKPIGFLAVAKYLSISDEAVIHSIVQNTERVDKMNDGEGR